MWPQSEGLLQRTTSSWFNYTTNLETRTSKSWFSLVISFQTVNLEAHKTYQSLLEASLELSSRSWRRQKWTAQIAMRPSSSWEWRVNYMTKRKNIARKSLGTSQSSWWLKEAQKSGFTTQELTHYNCCQISTSFCTWHRKGRNESLNNYWLGMLD